jgi:hypothetical protein
MPSEDGVGWKENMVLREKDEVKVDILRPRKPRGTWDTCSKPNSCKT